MTRRISDIYQQITSEPTNDKLWKSCIWEGPTQSDVASWQAQGYGVYQGKIRTDLSRDGRIQLLHSDRLTAFDRLIDHVPLKGVILAAISRYWLEEISRLVPTHFIKLLGPRALLVESTRPIKAEIVVRSYLSGSLARAYASGQRSFCGVTLPQGLENYERLPEPIITPTTKALAFEHDENITPQELVQRGICTEAEWDQMTVLALKIFSIGSKLYDQKGWILVDTKYEFGKAADGTLKLIDEVHTPDSSRLWRKESYESQLSLSQPPEMFDKENVRRFLLSNGFSGFGEVPTLPRLILLDLAKTYLHVAESVMCDELTVD